MKKIKIILLIFPVFLFAEMKLGYIDSNRIMSEFENVRDIQVELEKEQRKLEAEYNGMISQLDSLKQVFEKQRLLMSENRRKEKENELINIERNIQEFQMKKFGPEGEIYRKQSQLLAPILEEVDAAIKVVAAQRGYDYVFDAVSGAIVYALEAHDLTDQVLKELKGSGNSE
ncbi:MAG: molecular chaperone Skp [Candidatus Marinimicrobia bacterium]|nr:molecular chaperone Skp [Candidatus Neomarinimicrobiota bacterium]|tara:strand:+ start:79 stop:594 length:516 start_codon:yes stop_codon:yes gene_type:complete